MLKMLGNGRRHLDFEAERKLGKGKLNLINSTSNHIHFLSHFLHSSKMLSISFPSLKSFLPFGKEKDAISLPSVKIHNIESSQEKPARALKHLLKLNHASHAILYNNRKFHNHAPHVCDLEISHLLSISN